MYSFISNLLLVSCCKAAKWTEAESMIHLKWNAKIVKIVCVILCYWTISISLVFANKYLVGSQNSSSDISLFVAWIQCIIVVCVILFQKIVRACITGDWSKLRVKTSHITHTSVILLTCSFVSMLSFNNMCLKNVGVSFYQVAKSLTLIFTVVFSICILKKTVSGKIFVCCLVVVSGFVLGVDQEKLIGTLSFSGVVFGVISSIFVSLNGIFTKKALDTLEGDSVQLTFLYHLNASFVFFPIVLFTGQLEEVRLNTDYQGTAFWGFLIISGAMGFLIAWVSAVQINLTSPVTHHIVGNSKAVIQILIAVSYYHEHKPALWWASIGLVIGGATAYALIKYKEEHSQKLVAIAASTRNETDYRDIEKDLSKRKDYIHDNKNNNIV